jgi:hypothetical protein
MFRLKAHSGGTHAEFDPVKSSAADFSAYLADWRPEKPPEDFDM